MNFWTPIYTSKEYEFDSTRRNQYNIYYPLFYSIPIVEKTGLIPSDADKSYTVIIYEYNSLPFADCLIRISNKAGFGILQENKIFKYLCETRTVQE